MSTSSIIQTFVDKSIQELIIPQVDFFYLAKADITNNRFIDLSKPEIDGKVAWKPIHSLISDTEIVNLEKELKTGLPPSFKEYLKYKNFYELANLCDVWMFCPLIPDMWSKQILNATFNRYSKEYIYDKGLIPFANYSDWGLTCFNTNQKGLDLEYEIVMWDHERPGEFEVIASNCYQLFENCLGEFEKSRRA